MKHKLLRALITLAVLLVAGSLVVLAAYTTNGQELISLGYLEQTFLPKAVSAGEAVYQAHEDTLFDAAKADLEKVDALYNFRMGELDGSLSRANALQGLRFKQGDVLTVGTGSSLLLLAGEAQMRVSSGAVVDATAGQETSSPSALQLQHRYLVAERTISTVSITSDTAVLALEGPYSLSPSSNADYNMIADALKAMGLFKGSDTGYGAGYDLEKAPTRIQGLIMFLRLIGEEEDALASTAASPFTDVPAWCERYVAYAFAQGYTKGVSATEFGPSLELRATEYITFVLRCLGYSDSGDNADFAWDTALAKGLQTGLLTAREHKKLTEDPFLRAQVVYISYYAMDAKLKTTGESLYAHLTGSGALDKTVGDAARTAVTSTRMR